MNWVLILYISGSLISIPVDSKDRCDDIYKEITRVEAFGPPVNTQRRAWPHRGAKPVDYAHFCAKTANDTAEHVLEAQRAAADKAAGAIDAMEDAIRSINIGVWERGE